jgi:phosphohistidine swiveling domain-containing protein
LKGIITLDGSPTAHPMLIGRERDLPVICGVPKLIEKLTPLDGMIITMDGLSKWVYKGEKPLRTATREEFEKQFEVQ